MKHTRKHILEIINNKGEVTARELSRALGVTQADIRHHLKNMLAEGLIVVTGKQREARRGRPSRRYSLTAVANKDYFDLLASALLSASLENLHPDAKTTYLNDVAIHLLGEFNPQGPLVQRLGRAVSHLNGLGYQARWEAHTDAPRIILEHPPFAKLYARHPELHELDASIINNLLAENVSLIQSDTAQDEHHYVFQINIPTTNN